MQKVLKILEKYVQWAALGLGVLFLLYLVWGYIINNPAAKSITIGRGGASAVTPATVDQKIDDEIKTDLAPKISASHPEFHIDVKIPTAVSLDPAPSTQPVAPVASSAWDSWAIDFGTLASTGNPNARAQVVQSLPVPPALKYVDQETFRTVLALNSQQPDQHQDVDAVTTFWSIPAADLAKAYKASFSGKIPDPAILFVQTTLIRQEQLPSGQWGPDVIIARPANLPIPPVAYPPPPGPNAKAQYDQYRQWAVANQLAIVNPPFPDAAFKSRPDLTWQPLASWIPFRAQKAALDAMPIVDTPTPAPGTPAPQPVRNSAPQPAAPAGGGGGGAFDPNDIDGPQNQKAQPAPAPVRAPVAARPGITPPAAAATPPPVNVPVIPQLASAGETAVALSALNQDLGVFFHDLTAEPGKNYRYRARYTLLNPVYNNPGKVAKTELSDAFGLDSIVSDWSETIAVPARTRFWCSAKQLPSHSATQVVTMTVFTWHDGRWQKKEYSVAPGDEIGANEGAAGNFLTQWTLLDVKSIARNDNPNHALLIVPDDGGPAQRRDVLSDVASQDFKRLNHEYNAQPPPDPTAGGQASLSQPPFGQPAAK